MNFNNDYNSNMNYMQGNMNNINNNENDNNKKGKKKKKATDEHISILEFIRDGQAEEAKNAMLRHIGRSMENMLAYYPEE